MKDLTIDSLPDFQNPLNVTEAEIDYAKEIMGILQYDIYDEFAIQLEMTKQHLFNYIINLNRHHLNDLVIDDINSIKKRMVIDRVYHFDTLADITDTEIQYAEKILNRLNHDLVIITPYNESLSHDYLVKKIIHIKRISDSLGL